MHPAAYVDAIDRDGRAVVEAGKARLDAPVEACPGWVVADVLGHLGRVHRSVSDILETRTRDAPTAKVPAPPPGDEVVTFFEAGLDRLLAAMAAIEPDTPVYTWAGEGTAAFYFRRMAHEIAIHRYDAQTAVLRHRATEGGGGKDHAVPDGFDAELAADAIDELFDIVLPFAVLRRDRQVPSSTMHVHRTDGPGEWLVRGVDGRLVVTREHAKGDVAVRGPASDLLVFLWNRGRSDALELFGDDAAAAAWTELAP